MTYYKYKYTRGSEIEELKFPIPFKIIDEEWNVDITEISDKKLIEVYEPITKKEYILSINEEKINEFKIWCEG